MFLNMFLNPFVPNAPFLYPLKTLVIIFWQFIVFQYKFDLPKAGLDINYNRLRRRVCSQGAERLKT